LYPYSVLNANGGITQLPGIKRYKKKRLSRKSIVNSARNILYIRK
jgi:hypothetical protein